MRAWVLALSMWVLAGDAAWAKSPEGLYLMTRFMGGSLEMKVWYFESDAFALEPRAASKPFDFDEVERLSPGSTAMERTYYKPAFARGDLFYFGWIVEVLDQHWFRVCVESIGLADRA